jgi:hypothetical protein
MAYNAKVFEVMIASPGDVPEERNLIRDIIHEWNDLHSAATNFVLRPVMWETHAAPDLSGRAQGLINQRLLEKCDVLVGVFWTRLGSPTGVESSGTVEEIKRHVEAGKPAMVYFSTAPVAPDSLDLEQYKAVKEFKNWCKERGLIEGYDNIADFSEKFRRHIQIIIRDNEYLKQLGAESHLQNGQKPLSDTQPAMMGREIFTPEDLSTEAAALLEEAGKDRAGVIMCIRFLSGQAIQTNGRNFADSNDRRSVARWEAAVNELLSHNLIAPRGTKGEIFEVTNDGYGVADILGRRGM